MWGCEGFNAGVGGEKSVYPRDHFLTPTPCPLLLSHLHMGPFEAHGEFALCSNGEVVDMGCGADFGRGEFRCRRSIRGWICSTKTLLWCNRASKLSIARLVVALGWVDSLYASRFGGEATKTATYHRGSKGGALVFGAMKIKDCLIVMNDKMDSIHWNGTWVLEPLPQGKRPISKQWVFKAKQNAEGKVIKCKAWLAVRGCEQHPGLDYEETFAPVVK